MGFQPGVLQATFWPGGRVPSDGHIACGAPTTWRGGALVGLPRGEPARLPTVLPASARARPRVRAAMCPARVVPIRAAVRALAALPMDWPALATAG